jgi:hypothetical protein
MFNSETGLAHLMRPCLQLMLYNGPDREPLCCRVIMVERKNSEDCQPKFLVL